jgi:phosphohistidine phosphatase
MKTIILVRHAQSSWSNPVLDDFERPLNKRGKKDALFMGQQLKEKQIVPDIVLSSSAKRARETAIAISKAIDYPKKKIILDDNMYHSDAMYLLELARNQDDENEMIMLFGHNPGFSNFADILLKQNPVYNIPTTGIYCIRFDVDKWKQVQKGNGEAVFFDYPKH